MLLRVAAAAAAAAKVVHGCEAAEPENYAGEWVAVAVTPAIFERRSQGAHGQVHVSARASTPLQLTPGLLQMNSKTSQSCLFQINSKHHNCQRTPAFPAPPLVAAQLRRRDFESRHDFLIFRFFSENSLNQHR